MAQIKASSPESSLGNACPHTTASDSEMQVLLKWGSMGCEHGHCALELMRFILGHRDHCNCPEGPSSYKSGVGVGWERGSADVP